MTGCMAEPSFLRRRRYFAAVGLTPLLGTLDDSRHRVITRTQCFETLHADDVDKRH